MAEFCRELSMGRRLESPCFVGHWTHQGCGCIPGFDQKTLLNWNMVSEQFGYRWKCVITQPFLLSYSELGSARCLLAYSGTRYLTSDDYFPELLDLLIINHPPIIGLSFPSALLILDSLPYCMDIGFQPSAVNSLLWGRYWIKALNDMIIYSQGFYHQWNDTGW